MLRWRLTIVVTAMTWSGSVAWRIPRKKPSAMMESKVIIVSDRGSGAKAYAPRSRTPRILTNSLDFRHALCGIFAGRFRASLFAKRAFAFTNRLNGAKTGVRIKMQNVQEDTHEARGIFQPVDFSFSGFFSSIAVQALREVGRADGCGFSPGHSAIEGNLPAAIRLLNRLAKIRSRQLFPLRGELGLRLN